jgi:hypothetical protein
VAREFEDVFRDVVRSRLASRVAAGERLHPQAAALWERVQ